MLVIQDITRVLDAFAPAPLAEGYDNAGLLTGTPLQPCTGVLTTLDVTPGGATRSPTKELQPRGDASYLKD